jgi:Phosphosulfolactate phosphohydrolase and related enzymes
MKKLIGFAMIACLLFIFSGCGGSGGSGGSKHGNIYFTMPVFYYEASEAMDSSGGGSDSGSGDESTEPTIHAIPANNGWTVKFYTVTEEHHSALKGDTAMNTVAFTPDNTFIGTTGSSNDFQFSLPDPLKNQKRYIYMLVTMNGSFDPVGKTQQEVFEAVMDGEVLFGSAIDFDAGGDKFITLSNDVRITNFSLVGEITAAPEVSVINFTVPDAYYTSNQYSSANTAAIPGGKKIKFYTLNNLPSDTSPTINADSTVYNGTTSNGGSTLQFILPDILVGKNKYVYAVVILGADFDLQGKTADDLKTAMENHQVLLGKTADILNGHPGNDIQVELSANRIIDNFTFMGIPK